MIIYEREIKYEHVITYKHWITDEHVITYEHVINLITSNITNCGMTRINENDMNQ